MQTRFHNIKICFKKVCILQSFFVCLGCFLFVYYKFGFYYTEYEGINDNFLSGKLTDGTPFKALYFLCHIGTSHIYSALYQVFPKIEWISWLLYIYSFISSWLILYIIQLSIPKYWNWTIGLLIQLTVFFLIFADQNIHFNFTRVSYLLTGGALFALIFLFHHDGSIKQSPFRFILINLMFVLGTLTRTESTTMIFAQLFFLNIFFVGSFKQLVTINIFPFVFLVSVLSIITYDIYTTTDFYKQIEPEIEAQFCERGNMIPLSEMKSLEDSVKWNMAAQVVWSDPKILTPKFLRSLIKKDVPYFFDLKQWRRAGDDLLNVLVDFYPLSFIAFILIFLTLLTINFPPKQLLLYLVLVFSFWAIMLMQAYTFKINARSFSPPLCFYLLSLLIIFLSNYKEHGQTLKLKIGIAAFTLFFILHVNFLYEEARKLKSDFNSYILNLNTISQKAKGKYLVVNSSSCDFIFCANKPFYPFDYTKFKKIYIVDGFTIPFLPYYRQYLEKECKCNTEDFPSFWGFLRGKGDEVVVLSQPERITTLKEYLVVIHNYNLPLYIDTTVNIKPVQRSDSRFTYYDINLYRFY